MADGKVYFVSYVVNNVNYCDTVVELHDYITSREDVVHLKDHLRSISGGATNIIILNWKVLK
jgi:hypothetical protein